MNEKIEIELFQELPPEFSKGGDLPQICYLCGESLTEGYTEDHLPPKGLFPKEDKPNLLKLRACKKCHPKRDLDMNDEYFRNCLEVLVGKNNMSAEVISNRKRAWERRPLQAIDMLTNTERAFLKSDDSVVLRPIYLVKMKSHRINSVIKRIGKGFHFARWKERIPTITNVYLNESSISSRKQDRLLYPIAPEFILIPGKFTVRYWLFRRGTKCESNWIFRFYDSDEAEFFVKFEWSI